MKVDFHDFSNININTDIPIKGNILLSEYYRLKEYNYNTDLKELVITKELIQKICQLRKIKKPIIKTTRNIKIRFNQIACAQKFLNKYFKLHPVPTDINKQIHPFNLNISFNNEEPFFGTINTKSITNNKNITHVIYGIELSQNITCLTGAIYTHEIIHSQLITKLGSIKELYNHEVLPIFIELLYILEYNNKNNNLFKLHDYIRLKELITYFNNLILSKIFPLKTNYNLVDYNIFITSTITAYKLFNIYINSSIKQKEYLIQNIQYIFDGKCQLEDLLTELNINFNNKKKKKSLFS